MEVSSGIEIVTVLEPLASIYLTAVGLVVGSFLNVCIYRLPKGESIVRPPSHCPSCRKQLRWFHNVPVLSWIVLRRRCGFCRAPISWRYPSIELASGAIVLGAWWTYGPTPEFIIAVLFAWAMLVLFFTDYDHKLLPDVVTLGGFALGMLLAWWNPILGADTGWPRIWAALYGAGFGSGVLWTVGALYSRFRGVEAMGMGDVKMLALVGAFTGVSGVILTIFAGSVVGAIIGILLVPLRGRSMQDTLPFGCFLAPAALAALLWGQQIAAAYLQLLRLPM